MEITMIWEYDFKRFQFYFLKLIHPTYGFLKHIFQRLLFAYLIILSPQPFFNGSPSRENFHWKNPWLRSIRGLAMLLVSIFYHWKKPWLRYFRLRVGFDFSTTRKHLMNRDALGDFVMFKPIMKNLLYSNIN